MIEASALEEVSKCFADCRAGYEFLDFMALTIQSGLLVPMVHSTGDSYMEKNGHCIILLPLTYWIGGA
ncbi:hypothetical protein Y1Q_0001943 [Alligator mississippiensis]|uniref:Uncharacterized protein n=1 Tax=Alligator mississippiensis TaxID=8496 RepID=A0A151PGI6_ALLMI|nr:hypothetical protein Y1Q_0001943 [Alligator mississippiensis]